MSAPAKNTIRHVSRAGRTSSDTSRRAPSGYAKALSLSGSQSKRIVRLHGELGEKFGHEHQIVAFRGSEIIRHLSVFYQDFVPYFAERKWEMKIGERALDYEAELKFPLNSSTVDIYPVIEGGKTRGLGKILMGIAIIGLTIATSGGFGAIAAGFGGGGGIAGSVAAIAAGGATIPILGLTTGTIGLMFGTSMILGGMAQALAPKLENNDPSKRGDESFVFNGIQNSTGEGQPVPLAFGKVMAGSHVIHGSLRNKNIRNNSVREPPENQLDFNPVTWMAFS